MCRSSRDHPKAYLHQGQESQWFHDALSLSPRPKSYLGQKQMLNEWKNTWKKVEVYFSAPSVVPWRVQWDITTYSLPGSHHFSPKTWWFSSLYGSAAAWRALGCAPLRHAYDLRVHKMPAKQIVTKSSECPELFPSLEERWRWVDLSTRWLRMLEWDCKGSCAVPNSCMAGQTPTPRAFLALFVVTVGLLLWVRKAASEVPTTWLFFESKVE